MKTITTSLLILLGLMTSALPGNAEPYDEGWKAVGVRAGLSATKKNEFFHRYDAFATYGLPWALRGESGWGVAMQANISAGALHGGGETGFIGAVGPKVVLDKGGRGLGLELGADLNGISRREYGRHDFNAYLLFEGYLGLNYRVPGGVGIGYRAQHMSNGGLGIHGSGNPGVDLHTVSLSWNY